MENPNLAMRELAQRLIAAESARRESRDGAQVDGAPGDGAPGDGAPGKQSQATVQVTEKLRITLTRFAGRDGFYALLSRALALSKAQVPALQPVKIRAEGSLEGFLDNTDGGVVLIAHLLGLLATFIGESITLRLLREAWPEETLDLSAPH